MKLLAFGIGLISSIAISLGWLFSTLHLTGATQLHVLGYLGLIFLFLPLFIALRYRSIMAKGPAEKLKYLLGLLSALLAGAGLVFKMLHLTGAVAAMSAGFGIFTAGFLPLLFYTMYRNSIA